MKDFETIRKIYLRRYPHLRWCETDKHFAFAALLLAAPAGITPMDTWTMAKIANNYKEA